MSKRHTMSYTALNRLIISFCLCLFYAHRSAAQSCDLLCNTSFDAESLVSPGNFSFFLEGSVSCWKTTATDDQIEVWGTGFLGVPSYEGNQFIELNANMVSTIYQDFVATPGSSVAVDFAHRGRDGADVMSVSVGPVGGPYVTLGSYTADNTGWQYHTVNYTFPTGVGNAFSLRFNSISAAGGPASGNFLDAISITLPEPVLSLTAINPSCTNTNNGSVSVAVTSGTAPYSYSWSPVSGSTPTISNLDVGTYTVTVTDGYGCSAQASTTLTGDGSIVNLTEMLCQGDSYTFNGVNYTTAGSHSATFVTSGGCDSVVNLTLQMAPVFNQTLNVDLCAGETYTFNGQTYATSGTYVANLQTIHGCDSIVTLNLHFQTFNGSVTQPTGPICPNVPYQLQASGGSIYIWTPANVLNNANVANPIATVAQTTTFTVIISDGCGADTLLVTLPVYNDVATISPDTDVCIGNGVTLTATGGGTYSWSPAATLSDPTVSNPFASPTTTTTYTVVITSPNGCTLNESVVVQVFLTPPVPVLADTIPLCAGTSKLVTAAGATSYAWSPATAITPLTGPAVTVNPANSITYYCDFTNACGTVRDSVYVDVIIPVVTALSDTTICPGTSVQLTATGGVSYSWSPTNSLNQSTGTAVLASPAATTEYQVVGTDINGCNDTSWVTVTLFQRPDVEACPDVTTFLGDAVNLGATSSGNGTYEWSPADYLSCTDCVNPVALPDHNMLYTVTFTDENGCVATDEVEIRYDPLIFVPNTFTPDGRIFNNTFFPVVGNVSSFEFKVYSRWGDTVFQTTQKDEAWDGMYNGFICPDGTYTWMIKFTDFDGEEGEMIGHVNLMR